MLEIIQVKEKEKDNISNLCPHGLPYSACSSCTD
jgi:hypothetical protein